MVVYYKLQYHKSKKESQAKSKVQCKRLINVIYPVPVVYSGYKYASSVYETDNLVSRA